MLSNSWADTAKVRTGGLTLGVQGDRTMFELMKGGVVVFVDAKVLLFKSLKFVFALPGCFHDSMQLRLQLAQIGGSPFHIFLRFKEEDLLFFVMGLHRLG